MKDQKYWQRRAVRYERGWNKRCAETVEKRLARYYEKSLSAIKNDILQLYATFAKDNGLDFNEARRALSSREFREWRMSMREYIEANDAGLTRELNALAMQPRISRLEKLYGETLQELDRLGRKVDDDMRNFLTDAYKSNYARDIFDLVKVGGMAVAWAKVDSPSVEKVLAARWSGKNYSQRVWSNTRLLSGVIRETVATGVHRGLSIPQLSRMIEDKMHAGYSSAVNLVRTEMNFVNNQAHADSMSAAGIGWYEFIAVLDNRTSAPCRSRDGEAYSLEEKTVGFNYPPLHPRCRSTVAPYIEGAGRRGTRIAKVGKDTIHIPVSMSYRDYEAVYVKKTQTLEQWLASKKDDIKLHEASIVSTGTAKKVPLTEEQIAMRRYLLGKSPQPATSSTGTVTKQTTLGQSSKSSVSSSKKSTTIEDLIALRQKLSVKSQQSATSNTSVLTGKNTSGQSDKNSIGGSKKLPHTEEQIATRRYLLGISSQPATSSTNTATKQMTLGQSGKSSVSGSAVTKQMTLGQSGKSSVSGSAVTKQTTVTKSDVQATLKQQIESLRKKLEQQRAAGVSQAEMEKTIKEAGKLIVEQIKKIKPFDLPAGTRVDYEVLVKTWNEFVKKLKAMDKRAYPKEYAELKSICAEIKADYTRLLPFAREHRMQIDSERAKQIKDILSQVRQIGTTKEQLDHQFGVARSQVRAITESALTIYPSEWIEASIKHGRIKLINTGKSRSFYKVSACELHLGTGSHRCISAAIHELAHRLERSVEGLLKAEAEFYARRTAGEKLQNLEDLYPNSGYVVEYSRIDKFLHPYMGKDYGGSAYELVSMGFQYAYTEPFKLLQDEDMAQWIYGLLAIF